MHILFRFEADAPNRKPKQRKTFLCPKYNGKFNPEIGNKKTCFWPQLRMFFGLRIIENKTTNNMIMIMFIYNPLQCIKQNS